MFHFQIFSLFLFKILVDFFGQIKKIVVFFIILPKYLCSTISIFQLKIIYHLKFFTTYNYNIINKRHHHKRKNIMNISLKIILILSIIALNLNTTAQQKLKVCDKDDPFTELDWIVNYPIEGVEFRIVELHGEFYIQASDKGYYTCAGELYCETSNSTQNACTEDFTRNGLQISSSIYASCIEGNYNASNCPVIYKGCIGEGFRLNMETIRALELPPIAHDDVCCYPDFSYGDYHFSGPEGRVCSDCWSVWVYPEKTTMYIADWTYFGRGNGKGHFLVVVEDCGGSIDVYPSFHRTEKVKSEGIHTVTSYWLNEGPAFFEGVDFIWEVNGEIDTIYAWSKGRTIYGGANLSNDGSSFSTHHGIYFEPDTEYRIKVIAVNPNGLPDLNPDDNVQEFIIAPFEAKYDLSLIESDKPFNTETGEVKVDLRNNENGRVKNFVVRWSVNGVEQPPHPKQNVDWDERRVYLDKISVTLGSLDFDINQDYDVRVWLDLPENITDIKPANNSLSYYYSAADKEYYDADITRIICKEDSTILRVPGQTFYTDGCNNCYILIQSLYTNPPVPGIPVYNWTKDEEIISTDYVVTAKPEESSFYKLYANSRTSCFDNCTKMYLDNIIEPTEITYSVVVIDSQSCYESVDCPVLKDKSITLQPGETISLKDMVVGDQSGFWNGQGVFSVSTVNDETLYFYSSNKNKPVKLFYTIDNEFCKQTLTLVVWPNGTSNLKASNSLIKVFPNPVDEKVFIKLPGHLNDNLRVAIYNVSGTIIQQVQPNKNDLSVGILEFDLSDLDKGIYLMEVQMEDFIVTEKLFVE